MKIQPTLDVTESGFRVLVEGEERAPSLDFGEACGLSVRDYEALPDWANTDELLADWLTEREIVLRLVSGYAWRWGADTAEVLATEQSFSLPIVNPETGRSTPSFRFAGKIDKIVRVELPRRMVERRFEFRKPTRSARKSCRSCATTRSS